MRTLTRRPGIGYIDTHKWVPLDHPQVPALKLAYKYYLPGDPCTDESEILHLYKEAPHHLIVPRTAEVDCNFVDLRPKFKKTKVESIIKLDWGAPSGTQHRAFRAWMDSECGILNLACAKGKTIIALHTIAQKKVPTLIVLGTLDLMNQWKRSACNVLKNYTEGIIQYDPSRWIWRGRDIIFASARSLGAYIKECEPEFFKYFGLIIFDEGHHVPATIQSLLSDVFWGERRALTATANRGDGRDPILHENIGPIFYSDLMPETEISVCFQTSPFYLSLKNVKEARDVTGNLTFGKVVGYVGTYEPRNRWIIELISWIRQRKNKVLSLSHSKDHLYILREMMIDSGFDPTEIAVCTGDEDPTDRLEKLKSRPIGLGTMHLVREALDVPDLDTLLILSPVGSGTPGENSIQQAFGRTQRRYEGKSPWVIIVLDANIRMLGKMGLRLLSMLDRWPRRKGGPIPYTISPANSMPYFEGESV